MHELLNIIHNHIPKIEDWLNSHNFSHPNIYYSSVDLRYSGTKLVPIDVNIFPAGFNNLSQEEILLTKKITKDFISKYYPTTKRILLITENHTRNLHYFDNIYVLSQVLNNYDLTISNFNIENEISFDSKQGHKILYHPLRIKDQYLIDQYEIPYDLIILNNDLSSGIPEKFKEIKNPIIPSVTLGWYNRTKSGYFRAYNYLIDQLAKDLSLNLAVIKTNFLSCKQLDFRNQIGLTQLRANIEELFNNIKQEYAQLGIQQQPYIFIKAERGTYGMGVMSIKDVEELTQLNRHIRKKMNVIKEGMVNSEVIIQEGIATIDSYNNYAAEPMVYLIDHQIISYFSRVNISLDQYGNLNSQGMFFTKTKYEAKQLELIKIIARLASCAINIELQNLSS